MRRIHPLVRLTALTFAVIFLFGACGGDDPSPSATEDGGEQAVGERPGAVEDDDVAGTVTPEQREQAAPEVQAQTSRRNVDLGVTAPTVEGEAQPLASIVEGGVLDVERIARSVVRVEPAIVEDGDFSIVAFGTGSIIDRRGLILTNFHVIDPAIGHDVILIAVTGALDQSPREKFIAEVQVADPILDLAVLRIVSDLSGEPVKPSALNLTEIPQGDSSQVQVLDQVLAFGYPDIGDETLTVTAGTISGFLSQAGVSDRRSWFKTDTTISFGNSGGAAVNAEGFLIGIPTQGNFDEGGSIAHLRPLALAQPLIEAAQRGEVFEGAGARIAAPTPISDISFAPDLTRDGEMLRQSAEFEADVDLIFYSYNFQGLSPVTAVNDIWLLDGAVVESLVLLRDEWTRGSAGTFVDGIQAADAFPSGIYTLEIWVDDLLSASRSLSIGDVDFSDAALTSLVVANGVDPLGAPTGTASDFAPGVSTLFAFFEYENGGGIPFVDDVWYREGELIPIARPGPGPWNGGDSGQSFVAFTDTRGFAPGTYTVEIYFGTDLAGTADFTVGAGLSLSSDGDDLALGELATGTLLAGDVALFRLTGFATPPGPGEGLFVKLDGEGDADLYVKRGAPPEADELNQSWDEPSFQAPFVVGSDETVFLPGASPGEWWIAVVGYDSLNTFTLRASISAGTAAGQQALALGETVSDVLPLEGDFDEYLVNVPAGTEALTVSIVGEGDADLYVQSGSPVTQDVLDQVWNGPETYAPYVIGSEEFVSITSPAAGSWFIRVQAFVGQSSYTLSVDVGTAVAVGEFGSDPFLDGLYSECEAGSFQACDDLYFDAPVESSYEVFGDTCGNRQTIGTGILCTETFGDGPDIGIDGGLGTDPALDALQLQCGNGDFAACDELYFQSPIGSAYEEFGDTCGGRQALGTGTLCTDAFGDGDGGGTLAGAFTFGDDPALDALWNLCSGGDFAACDDLFAQSPLNSDYEFFGDTCGGRQASESGFFCTDVFGEGEVPVAGAFGSDDFLDSLYIACDAGDLATCADLYFESPPDSEYETFGDTCGGLQALGTGQFCTDLGTGDSQIGLGPSAVAEAALLTVADLTPGDWTQLDDFAFVSSALTNSEVALALPSCDDFEAALAVLEDGAAGPSPLAFSSRDLFQGDELAGIRFLTVAAVYGSEEEAATVWLASRAILESDSFEACLLEELAIARSDIEEVDGTVRALDLFAPNFALSDSASLAIAVDVFLEDFDLVGDMELHAFQRGRVVALFLSGRTNYSSPFEPVVPALTGFESNVVAAQALFGA